MMQNHAIEALPPQSHQHDEAIAVRMIGPTIGDTLLSIRESISSKNKNRNKKAPNKEAIHRTIGTLPKRIVLLALVDQNWGFLASSKCSAVCLSVCLSVKYKLTYHV